MTPHDRTTLLVAALSDLVDIGALDNPKALREIILRELEEQQNDLLDRTKKAVRKYFNGQKIPVELWEAGAGPWNELIERCAQGAERTVEEVGKRS